MRALLLAIQLSTGAAIAGCAVPASPDPSAGPVGSPLLVERGPLVQRVLLTGEVEAESAVAFVAPNVGQWPIAIQTLPQSGETVRAGEVAVEFDSTQLAANLDNQRMAVIRAEAELESTRLRSATAVAEKGLEARRRDAELEKARVAASVPAELRAERDYEELRLALERAQLESAEAAAALATAEQSAAADVAIQEVAVEKARDQLRYSLDALERVRLVAPRDGVLVVAHNNREDRTYQANDNAQPGDVVARLPDLSTLRVRARLFDVDDGAVVAGVPATVTLDAYPDEEWAAEVRSVQSIAQQSSGRSARRAFDVLVDLERIDAERLRPGMSAKVVVQREVPAADGGGAPLLAPRVALHFDATPRAVAGGAPQLGAAPTAAVAARLTLASGERVDVRVGACNATHCIVDGVDEGAALGRASR